MQGSRDRGQKSGNGSAARQGSAVAGRGSLVPGRGLAVAGRHSLVAGRCLPVAGHGSPVAGRESLVAGHCLPVAGRALAVAGRALAVAGRQSRVAGREAPVANRVVAVSPRRGRQRLAPGVSPGSAAAHHLSPAGATESYLRTIARHVASLTGWALILLLSACHQPPKSNGEIDIKPDIIRPSEAQSDFLDIGKQAGIEWLSFVPNDQNEYPDFYTGLDSDQKRRLRVAPLETPDERVLLEFKLPQGSKLWPVDWYGTELMAIELPGTKNISLALTKDDRPPSELVQALAESRKTTGLKSDFDDGTGGLLAISNSDDVATLFTPPNGGTKVAYAVASIRGRTSSYRVIVEAICGAESAKAAKTAVSSISIKRELALEGMPKHKCSSSLDELKQGKLVFPGGTLNLPLKDGQFARKTGGDSTIQVDGEGAKPWLLIRRLKEDDAPGDLRVRVRNDATFSRRTGKNPKGFGVGRRPEGTKIDAVVWDYSETAAEQQLVGVIAVGSELLSIEVVSRGLTDGDSRRAARDKALALIASATGTGAKGDPLKVLEGWNVGTMSKGQ